MPYYTRASAYLKRARAQLDSQTREALFYAAFELRCGVEARMRRYLDAHGKITQLRSRGWEIAKMAKQLENANLRDRACRMRVFDVAQQRNLEFCYIPVSSDLEKMAERLGDYLHCPRHWHDDDHPWWEETRKRLEKVYDELEYVCRGNLMGIPLLNPKTNKVHIEFETSDREGIEQAVRYHLRVHVQVECLAKGRRICFDS